MPITYTPIATYSAPSAQAFYTFNSIPSTYTDLVLVASVSSSHTGVVSFGLQFNGDTTTNYSETRLFGDGSTAYSDFGPNRDYAICGIIGNSATDYSAVITNINNYTSTTTTKPVLSRANYASGYVSAVISNWRKTPEAINTIKVFCGSGNIRANSTFTLYGILKA